MALVFSFMVRVKICGITRLEDALAAIDAGADALGFVLHSGSRRHISPAGAAGIMQHLPPYVTTVAVAVDLTLQAVQEIERTALFDVWQLHGRERPETCQALAPRRLVKSVPFPGDFQPEAFPVTAFLLDKASPAHGGTGETIDWAAAAAFCRKAGKPCVLAGGLNPNNVVRAVETVQPWGVDVSSGVETAPGIKDPRLIEEFIQACRSH